MNQCMYQFTHTYVQAYPVSVHMHTHIIYIHMYIHSAYNTAMYIYTTLCTYVPLKQHNTAQEQWHTASSLECVCVCACGGGVDPNPWNKLIQLCSQHSHTLHHFTSLYSELP